ncbi:hypothetical protein L3Q82_006659 [Scortum barcoo]|uniref:Uncharacterized protein n=1 Tax=Scortum barcoo TaxID=214431 RepID=A0ACB8WZX3_9TELE|nr:hypothetical protein L3Q82_006659 [Scortum barcoo]
MAEGAKIPKKGSKKTVVKAAKSGKKKRRTRKESYAIYVYKVLKQVHPDTGISSKAMGIMNSFVSDIFERIAGEASRLAHYNKRSTITSREIQTAVRLLLPGELAKHAVSEGTKAVTKYTSSKTQTCSSTSSGQTVFGGERCRHDHGQQTHQHLKRMVTNRTLIQTRGVRTSRSFKLPEKEPRAAKAEKPAGRKKRATRKAAVKDQEVKWRSLIQISEGSTSVSGQTGQNITLSCNYDVKHGALPACWNRGKIPLSSCNNRLISTDGHRVIKETGASSRYQLVGRLDKGDVSLTILNVSEGDSGLYGCRVEIPGWFNDETHHFDVTVMRVRSRGSEVVKVRGQHRWRVNMSQRQQKHRAAEHAARHDFPVPPPSSPRFCSTTTTDGERERGVGAPRGAALVALVTGRSQEGPLVVGGVSSTCVGLRKGDVVVTLCGSDLDPILIQDSVGCPVMCDLFAGPVVLVVPGLILQSLSGSGVAAEFKLEYFWSIKTGGEAAEVSGASLVM